MEKSTKIALGAGATSLAFLALALYLKKKKQSEAATVAGAAAGISASVAIWAAVVTKRNGRFPDEVGYSGRPNATKYSDGGWGAGAEFWNRRNDVLSTSINGFDNIWGRAQNLANNEAILRDIEKKRARTRL